MNHCLHTFHGYCPDCLAKLKEIDNPLDVNTGLPLSDEETKALQQMYDLLNH